MDKKIINKLKKLSADDAFLVTLTTYNPKEEDKNLDTYVFSNKFPYEEFEGTKDKIIELIDEQAETQFDNM